MKLRMLMGKEIRRHAAHGMGRNDGLSKRKYHMDDWCLYSTDGKFCRTDFNQCGNGTVGGYNAHDYTVYFVLESSSGLQELGMSGNWMPISVKARLSVNRCVPLIRFIGSWQTICV